VEGDAFLVAASISRVGRHFLTGAPVDDMHLRRPQPPGRARGVHGYCRRDESHALALHRRGPPRAASRKKSVPLMTPAAPRPDSQVQAAMARWR